MARALLMEAMFPVEASQVDYEATVAYGIDSSNSEIIIVPNILY